MQKPAETPVSADPLEATARVRRAASAPSAPVRPVESGNTDPMETTVRTRGFRNRAPKAADDWTKAAVKTPVKAPAAPQEPYNEEAMESTMTVRRAEETRTGNVQPVSPVMEEDPMEQTFRAPRGVRNPAPKAVSDWTKTPAKAAPAATPVAPAAPEVTVAVRPAPAAEQPEVEPTLAVRRIAAEQPAQTPVILPEQEAQMASTVAVRRADDAAAKVPAPEENWVDDTGLTDNVAADADHYDAPAAEDEDIGLFAAGLDDMDMDTGAAAAGTEEPDTGLFVAELDDMDPDTDHDAASETSEEETESDWDPEAQMNVAVQLVEGDDADEAAAPAPEEAPVHEVIINAPSAYKPMWDAQVGAEDQAMAEDFSMVMEAAAMASLPEKQVFFTSIVSVSELMESEDPGEAPEAWEDEWQSNEPGLVRINSLDAIEDFRPDDPGILEDVDDDVILAHKDMAGAEFSDNTHVTVRLVPASSEATAPRKRPDAQPVAPAAATVTPAAAAPAVRKPSAPVVGWLVCIRGGHYGESFPLVTGRNSIGRTPEMDVPLLKDESVTEARHAILTYEPRKRQFFIQPGESTGLVYLNEQLVFQYAELKAYDRVEFGDDAYLFMPLCGPSFGWDTAKDAAK